MVRPEKPMKSIMPKNLIMEGRIKTEYKTTDELKVLFDRNHKETSAFLKRLAVKKPKNLDTVVHQMHEQTFSEFSCLACANCCKTLGPRLTDRDIERLAKHLRIKLSDFSEKYLSADEDNDYIFNSHPCPFLMDDNRCMVYDQRPKACREYPHTDRKRFYQILNLTHKNIETCPAVYTIIENLKKLEW